jgi:hypothetical protein
MSGFNTKTVFYNDPYDCGKQTSEEEPYELEWFGTSDVIEFRRSGKCIAGLSKGDAWLFMKALNYFFEKEEWYMFKQKNPFEQDDE